MRTEADGTVTYFPLDQPETEVAVAWYLEMLPEPKGNVMAMVFRDGPSFPWRMVIRTRFYRDDKLGEDSKDERQGFMVTANPENDPEASRQELIEKIDLLLGDMMGLGLGRLYRQADHTDMGDFFRKWGAQPWTSLRHMTEEEVEKYRAGRP